jgi:hypothetical protein
VIEIASAEGTPVQGIEVVNLVDQTVLMEEGD